MGLARGNDEQHTKIACDELANVHRIPEPPNVEDVLTQILSVIDAERKRRKLRRRKLIKVAAVSLIGIILVGSVLFAIPSVRASFSRIILKTIRTEDRVPYVYLSLEAKLLEVVNDKEFSFARYSLDGCNNTSKDISNGFSMPV